MSVFRSAGALAATSFALSLAPTLAIGAIAPQVRQTEPQVRQTEKTLDTPNGPNGKAPMPTSSRMLVPVTSPAPLPTPSSTTPGCTPTTSRLRFDGGYEVSMCYRTPDTPDGTEGVAGQAKAGLYASAESGLLWFFSRDNAEVLVKVLNGCAINGYSLGLHSTRDHPRVRSPGDQPHRGTLESHQRSGSDCRDEERRGRVCLRGRARRGA